MSRATMRAAPTQLIKLPYPSGGGRLAVAAGAALNSTLKSAL